MKRQRRLVSFEHPHWLTAVLGAGMLAAAGACGKVESQPDGGADRSDADASPSDGGGSTADAEPLACSAEETCAPAVPEGWNGPVAFFPDTSAEACPAERPVEVQVTHQELDVPASSCDCSCGNPSGFTCDGPLILHARSNSCSDDVSANADVSFPAEAVVDVSAFDASSWSADFDEHPVPQVTGGECSRIEDFTIPAATFVDGFLTCAPEEGSPGACENGGTCLPEVTSISAPTCIYQEGDVACPDGAYSERTVTYQDIDDSRNCSPCTCGDPTGPCHGSVGFFIEGSGVFDAFSTTQDSCVDFSFTPTHGQFFPDSTAGAACASGGGALVGEATPADAVTTCCLPQ